MIPTTAKPARADVTFCAIDRVGARAFLAVCTTLDWRVYRLDKFSAARDSLTPVQVVLDDARDGALLSNVRMLRLFRLAPTASPRSGADGDVAATAPQLGGFFVSERCDEVDYSHVSPRRDTLDSSITTTDSSEDLAIFSFTHERILKRLPPTPSSVVDVQIQRSTAAVLCESHEILLVDLKAMCVQQRIASLASLAMALGPRWIAYPGLSPSLLDDDDDSDDGDEFVPQALVHGGSRQLLSATQSRSASISSASSPPAYNAIDVAQNVASGIYYLSKSIVPYLSSSPGTQPTTSIEQQSQTAQHNQQYQETTAQTHNQQTTAQTQNQQTQQHEHNALHAGWVVVQDFRTGRVVANFQCHATALVHLAFDFSGSLLATSSTKGQNVHVFRLLPPLATTASGSRGAGTAARHQLLYKLQRGITHASIADLAFSQDAKWLSVTSAHGTSHLYAIHPEGAAISPHTHVTDSSGGYGADNHSEARSGAVRDRDVSDFCAALRAVEPKTLARVVKIHHTLQATAVAAASVTPSPSYGSLGASSTASAFYYQTPPATLMNTALDASQALFSQLAQSTGIDFGGGYDEHDVMSRRRRRRRRMSCLFAHDGLKMAIYCDGTLKLYDLKVHAPVVPAVSGRSLRSALGGGSSSELLVKTRSSPFGFDATVSELKSWELLDVSRVGRTQSLSSGFDETPGIGDLTASSRARTSELRTFVQRGLPLWAHPKVSFRVIDPEHPEGLLLQVKRKGPSNLELGGDGLVHGGDDQQLFVMEMDSYFGLGGSPVFTGQSDQRVVPEVPRLDLAESMNLAISTSIKTPKYKSISVSVGKPVAPELTEDEHGTPVNRVVGTRKKNKKNSKQTAKSGDGRGGSGDNDAASSSDSSSTSTSASTSPTILQFTLQDMYFALPTGAEAQ